MRNVLIVGAGPAGLSAAFFLSQYDFDVTVYERLGSQQYARYHEICGGGISRSTFNDLKPMRPSGILNKVEHTRIIWPNGTEVRIRTKGYILDRPAFLSDLKEACMKNGVRFLTGTIRDIRESDGRYIASVSCGNDVPFDYVIGADGCSSVVRRSIFKGQPVKKVPATEFIVDRKADEELIIRLESNGSATYTWEFPRGKCSGTGGMKDRYHEEAYLMKGSRFIPIGGVGKIADRGAYLVGDAAAMANPISYGGLKAALISGKKAAEAVYNDDPSSYQKWWDSSILSDKRFMEFNETLKNWSVDEMNKAVRPFRHGGIYIPGLIACITQPKNINMYFGCLFAFRYGW